MHIFKFYGPRTGRQNSYGSAHGHVSGRTIFVQNSPGTARNGARECDVTEAKVKVIDLKNANSNFVMFKKLYTRHTFWRCLISCINMKWILQVLLMIKSGHDSFHRRTDFVKPVYPTFNFVEARGIRINMHIRNCVVLILQYIVPKQN